jgi:hypothetical protein
MHRSAISVSLAMLAVTACTSIAEQTHIGTRLAASEFNSVSSTYEERPTIVSLQTYSSGVVALVIDMDEYGMGKTAQYGIDAPNDYLMPLDVTKAHEYIAHIDKFFEWEELARSRGDIIQREIGSAPGAGYQTAGTIKFSLSSGNSTRHYLLMEFCAVGLCVNPMYFTPESARELKALLLRAGDGSVQHLDEGQIYK